MTAAAAVVALAVFACDYAAGPCACTEEFRSFLIVVVDDAGNPVSDVTLTRTNLRTGQVFQPSWLGMPIPGTYLVADDGLVDEFSSEGDPVQVTGEKDGATFAAQFVFAVLGPCRCHVDKLAGPDTVVIGEPPPP